MALQKMRRMTRRTRARPSTGNLQLRSRLKQMMRTMMTRMRTMRMMMRKRAVSQISCNDCAGMLHSDTPYPSMGNPLLLLMIGAAPPGADKCICKCGWLQGHEGMSFDMLG